MAAIDVPFLDYMHSSSRSNSREISRDAHSSTVAAFSSSNTPYPQPLSNSGTLVPQKSPLLGVTPPRVTRALASAFPFISTIDRALALVTWTTDDPWESFLVLAGFWIISLYGHYFFQWAGPLGFLLCIILTLYRSKHGAKDYSKRSSRSSDANQKRVYSLDEILDTINLFTSRCNILADPWIRCSELLASQREKRATHYYGPATAIFIRFLISSPVWIFLAHSSIEIITPRRVLILAGTICLSWHSKPARVLRTILWRSNTVRFLTSLITGLKLDSLKSSGKYSIDSGHQNYKTAHQIAASLRSSEQHNGEGVRFTFTLYENQRRWLGIGWTSNMVAYERTPWTDEQLNPAPHKSRFELPEVEDGKAMWKWVDDDWSVVHQFVQSSKKSRRSFRDYDSTEDDDGWVYYDSKWRDPRPGRDGWGRYTRRRKWCRDAILIDIIEDTNSGLSGTRPGYSSTPNQSPASSRRSSIDLPLQSTPKSSGLDISSIGVRSPPYSSRS